VETRAPAQATWRIASLVALGLAALVLGLYFFRLSATNAIGADQAGYLLYADDLLRGNWVFRGWTLPEDPYWVPDGFLYILGVAVRGLDPVILYAVPTLVCLALVLAMAVAATVKGAPRMAMPFVAVASVFPVLFPSRHMASVILMGPFHTGTIVVTLTSMVALYLAGRPGVRPSRRWTLAGATLLLLTLGRLGDPYTTILAVIPIVLVSGVRALACHDGGARSRHLLSMSVGAASWPGSLGALWLMRQLGGGTVTPFHPTIIPYSKVGDGVAALGLALLNLVGGNVFDRVVDASLVPALLRLAYLGGALLVTWLILRGEIRAISQGQPGDDWLTAVFGVAALVSVLGNMLGTSGDDIRYRVPPLVMMSVACSRWLGIRFGSWIAGRAVPAAIVGLVLMYFSAEPLGQYVAPPMVGHKILPAAMMRGSGSDRDLGSWLARHGLTYGYGGYPEASIVTVVTHGAVSVRPVASTRVNQPGLGPSHVPPADWRISPYRWLSCDAWYTARHDANFLVLNPAPSWDRDVGVDVSTAVKTFGPPSHIYQHVGRYTVLVWDGPIHF
jgi:hypothetical protein